ncbi:helix-turn-helix domain-containing protein [Neobacillus cucumis]|uniref:DNA-binding protein n=1 Tax=Neobacillus cucumis TaxID=1740721 RepID=A0A2N5H8W9_9BACI|nr:helix-turn-helix domain-containing protein [Neobacillus cucumis]PLS01945.1 DNA-binding protein [Neobacillus cucumis]
MKTIFELPDVLEVKDIQNFLRISRCQAYKLVKTNSFRVVKVGKRILVPKKSFLNWFDGGNHSD